MSKSTLRNWIELEADGEPIEAVVIGEMGWGDYASDGVPEYATHIRNVVLSWEQAQPYLEYEFSNDYGAPKCEAITAWTKSWVIAVSQYDGSTNPFRLPRNPVDHEPTMPGGG